MIVIRRFILLIMGIFCFFQQDFGQKVMIDGCFGKPSSIKVDSNIVWMSGEKLDSLSNYFSRDTSIYYPIGWGYSNPFDVDKKWMDERVVTFNSDTVFVEVVQKSPHFCLVDGCKQEFDEKRWRDIYTVQGGKIMYAGKQEPKYRRKVKELVEFELYY